MDSGFMMWAVAFIGVGSLIGWIRLSAIRRVRRLAQMSYDWYRKTYPSLVSGSGVKCHQCGGGRIHVRGLMQHTYLREHFCTQCGTTLYYSPEARA